jgi:hypothetical protein
MTKLEGVIKYLTYKGVNIHEAAMDNDGGIILLVSRIGRSDVLAAQCCTHLRRSLCCLFRCTSRRYEWDEWTRYTMCMAEMRYWDKKDKQWYDMLEGC